jgi:hypothetical protein
MRIRCVWKQLVFTPTDSILSLLSMGKSWNTTLRFWGFHLEQTKVLWSKPIHENTLEWQTKPSKGLSNPNVTWLSNPSGVIFSNQSSNLWNHCSIWHKPISLLSLLQVTHPSLVVLPKCQHSISQFSCRHSGWCVIHAKTWLNAMIDAWLNVHKALSLRLLWPLNWFLDPEIPPTQNQTPPRNCDNCASVGDLDAFGNISTISVVFD